MVGPLIVPSFTFILDVEEGLEIDHLFLSNIGELIVIPVERFALAGTKSFNILNNELSKNWIKRINPA